ncbi:MAG: YhbY family RNA-binding protein [Betaproteobacteria bacterium]|nr:YhbY family RNA-binding protein [Betaproteobacteria bacterium]
MLTLTPTERRALRASAHTLDPVVMIGQQGLTPAVLREIDRALTSHELIKVRIFNDDRAEREALQLAVCEQLACAPVQHLGKLIVLWRPAPPKKKTAPKPPAKRPAKKAAAKKALPGAINRHGQAVKPLSARQARQQTQASTEPWQSRRRPRDTDEFFADEETFTRRRSSSSVGRTAGRSGSRTGAASASGFETRPYGTGRGSSRTSAAAPRPAGKFTGKSTSVPSSIPNTRRRLGGRGKA